MASGEDINKLEELTQQLRTCVKSLRRNGEVLAKAEFNYKKILNTAVYRLRNDEALPITMINLLIYGESEVADARLKRDIAEYTYKANMEAINSCKCQINVLKGIIKGEGIY